MMLRPMHNNVCPSYNVRTNHAFSLALPSLATLALVLKLPRITLLHSETVCQSKPRTKLRSTFPLSRGHHDTYAQYLPEKRLIYIYIIAHGGAYYTVGVALTVCNLGLLQYCYLALGAAVFQSIRFKSGVHPGIISVSYARAHFWSYQNHLLCTVWHSKPRKYKATLLEGYASLVYPMKN